MNALVFWVSRLRGAMSVGVLSVVYFAVFVPFALTVSFFREDPLQRGFEPERTSYWEVREPEPAASLLGFFLGRGKGWMLPLVGLLLGVGALVVVTEGSMVFAFLYPLF